MLRQAQHERKVLNVFNSLSVRPEPCRKLTGVFQQNHICINLLISQLLSSLPITIASGRGSGFYDLDESTGSGFFPCFRCNYCVSLDSLYRRLRTLDYCRIAVEPFVFSARNSDSANATAQSPAAAQKTSWNAATSSGKSVGAGKEVRVEKDCRRWSKYMLHPAAPKTIPRGRIMLAMLPATPCCVCEIELMMKLMFGASNMPRPKPTNASAITREPLSACPSRRLSIQRPRPSTARPSELRRAVPMRSDNLPDVGAARIVIRYAASIRVPPVVAG